MGTVDEVDAPQVRQCPGCGAAVAVNARFISWCAACDWNVDPGAPDPERGRLAVFRRRLAGRHGQQLAEEIERSGKEPGRAGPDRSTVLAFGVSLLVHSVTGGLLLTAGLLIIGGWGIGFLPVLGVVLLVIVAALLPRPGRLPRHAPVLYRADAPQLFELIDEVAAVVGTTGVHAVVVDTAFNAGVSAYGVRNRRVMYLGAGLWEVLTPQERVALLGHELGHFANGDVRSSFVTHGALRTLAHWYSFLTPNPVEGFLDLCVNTLVFLPRQVVHGLFLLLDGLTMRASQRAEYLADAHAARAGSTAAAVTMLDRLLIGDAVEAHLRRTSTATRAGRGSHGQEAREAVERELWEGLAARIGSIPETEYERRRRVSARRGHSVDDTHPPTHLRRRCLAAAEPQPGQVVCDTSRAQSIATELAPARARLTHTLLRDNTG
ncbi:M48 family metalloprotease [Streptomyces sp. SID4919]|uniref:M48 family metallopeptidase n=1 Tax=unclassified Streptomyces TaxID=2593676 RepID=UPI000823B6B7|nr:MULTISPECIES: M48 family metallopeptidase [unclassified Streptomyces]MYY09366.1 M48 family metalloprotease [Streptomyces sp. SID4919]SCK43120.1 Zn-dependent protease with chaperone function [Streptomyces sp. AmelKG-E11A]